MIAFLLTLAAQSGTPPSESAPESRGATCRAGRIAFGYQCDGCRRTLAEVDMRDGRCKRCDEEPRKIEYCVKRLKPVFISTCVHRKKEAQPFRCCGKVYRTPTYPEDRARVTYACRSCGAKAEARADLTHAGSCGNAFAVDRLCAKSGVPPHVN
jgi:hypothetical protein